jgi:hypothetical protein
MQPIEGHLLCGGGLKARHVNVVRKPSGRVVVEEAASGGVEVRYKHLLSLDAFLFDQLLLPLQLVQAL